MDLKDVMKTRNGGGRLSVAQEIVIENFSFYWEHVVLSAKMFNVGAMCAGPLIRLVQSLPATQNQCRSREFTVNNQPS